MTVRACTRCGAIARLFGHHAVCDACRSELWAKERERLAEINEAKAAHPAGKSAKRRARRRWFIDLSAERNFRPALGEED